MRTVLFVDDEVSFLKSLRRLLDIQSPPWAYRFASSGPAAKEVVGQGGVDVVVTDLKMPRFDGLQLLDWLKKNSETCCTPVIMLTGKGDEESAVEAMHRGAADYLVKDFLSVDSLERAILSALQKLTLRLQVEEYYEQLENKVEELQEALDRMSRLEGLIPICMFCRKIRTDEKVWLELEHYIEEHSEASFSHSMCTACKKQHYPELTKEHMSQE